MTEFRNRSPLIPPSHRKIGLCPAIMARLSFAQHVKSARLSSKHASKRVRCGPEKERYRDRTTRQQLTMPMHVSFSFPRVQVSNESGKTLMTQDQQMKR